MCLYVDKPGTQFFDFSGNPLPTTAPLLLPFRYGRIDALTCDDTSALPEANFTFAQTHAFFGKFGMSVSEVVAIMGAHSLGRCFLDNSGFDGGKKVMCIYMYSLLIAYYCDSYYCNVCPCTCI